MDPSSIFLVLCLALTIAGEPSITQYKYLGHSPGGYDLKLNGDVGYVAGGSSGLLVYDMTDVGNTKFVTGFKLGEEVWRVIVHGSNTLYAIGAQNVWAFDSSDPWKPVLKNSAPHARPSSFRVDTATAIGHELYVTGRSDTHSDLIHFNIADSLNPVHTGVLSKLGTHTRTAVFQLEEYVSDGLLWRYYYSDENGLKTNDLPSNTNPIVVNQKLVQNHQGFASATKFVFYSQVISVRPLYLYVATGSTLYISKLVCSQCSDPTNYLSWHASVAYPQGGFIQDIEIHGNHLYVLVYTKLLVYSLYPIPESPTFVEEYSVIGLSLMVTAKGVFMQVSRYGLRNYVLNSGLLGSVYVPPMKLPVAHVTPDGASVRFLDYGIEIYQPGTNPKFFFYQDQVLAFASVGTQLFVSSAAQLFVLDISSTPRLVERMLLPGVEKMYIDGNFAYFACGSKGLVVMNIGGSIMRKVGHYAGVATSVIVSGTTAYLVDGQSLQVLDVCEPSSPKFLAKLDIAGATEVLVKDTTAYVIGTQNLVVVDVATPSVPVLLLNQAVPPSSGMAIAGNALFIAVEFDSVNFFTGSIVIRDISAPRVPTIVGSVNVGYPLVKPNLYAAGNYLFLVSAYILFIAPPLPSSASGTWGYTISGHTPTVASHDTGCFADYRALKSRSVAAYTPQQCFALCNTAGHTHAGTLFTSECWCGGASELVESARTNSDDCATSGHQNMAVKSSVRFSHVGCFEDNVGRTAYVSAEMSVEHCAAYCGGDTVRNYKFFGIQKGDTCWCTQDIRSKPPAASGDCNAPCIGNGEAFCGGTFRSNMYALNSMDFTVGVVTASETNAESQHTYPIEVEYWDGSVQVVGSVAAPAQGSVHVMTATGILQHPRKVRIRAQGGDGWKVHAVTMTFAGLGANWLTDGVLGKVVKNTPGSEVVEWTAPPGSS